MKRPGATGPRGQGPRSISSRCRKECRARGSSPFYLGPVPSGLQIPSPQPTFPSVHAAGASTLSRRGRGRRPGGLPHYSTNFKIIPVSVATHSDPSPAARNMARTAVARIFNLRGIGVCCRRPNTSTPALARSALARLQPRPGQAHRFVEFALQFLPRQRIRPVAGHVDAALLKLEQRDVFLAFAGAKDHAQRFGLVRFASMPLEPAQVEFHLAFIRCLEFAELQVDRDQAAELAVVKQQVQVVIPVVDLHPLLAGHETEFHPQFEDEGFHLPQDRRLQMLLGVGVFQPEKIEDVGIAEDQIGCELIFLAQLLEFQRRQFFWLPRQRGALEEHGTDLLTQRALVPALDAAHLGIEVALERVVQVDNEREVGPTQLCSQWLHNSGIREDLGKAHHIEEVTPREATAELRLQLCTQRGHYLLPILGPLLLHHVLPDAPPHVPIERGKARIHGPRYAFAGVQDQFPQVSEPAWTPAAGLEACPTTPPTSRSSPYPWPPTASHCPPPATWPARQWRGNRRPSPASRSSPCCAGFSTCAGSACVAACPPLPLPPNIRSRRAAAARP